MFNWSVTRNKLTADVERAARIAILREMFNTTLPLALFSAYHLIAYVRDLIMLIFLAFKKRASFLKY